MTNIQTWLDHGRTFTNKIEGGPWTWNSDEGDVLGPLKPARNGRYLTATPHAICNNDMDGEFIADARTRLPQALNALQAVIDLHKKRHPSPQMWRITPGSDEPQPVTTPDTCDYCGRNYPCPPVRAIQDAIGEDA